MRVSMSIVLAKPKIALRVTRPDLPRPFRVWAYPVTPLIFLGVTLFMLVYLAREKPIQSLAGVAMMLSGLLVFALSSRSTVDVQSKEPTRP